MIRLMLLSLMALFGAVSCTSTAPPDNNPDDNDGNGDNGMGDAQTFTLRVDVANVQGPSTGPRVNIFVADEAFDRLDAPYDGPLQVYRLAGSEEAGDTEVELQVEAGKMVTIVAEESLGFVTLVEENEDREFSQNNSEFLNFDGTYPTGSLIEEGVLAFTMNAGVTVTARYQMMPSLTVMTEGSDVIAYGNYSEIEVSTPQWLTRPEQLPEGTLDNPAGLNTGIGRDMVATRRKLLAQAQTGSTVRLIAEDLEGSGFVFFNWSGTSNNCGSNRECTLVLGEDSDVTATWQGQ